MRGPVWGQTALCPNEALYTACDSPNFELTIYFHQLVGMIKIFEVLIDCSGPTDTNYTTRNGCPVTTSGPIEVVGTSLLAQAVPPPIPLESGYGNDLHLDAHFVQRLLSREL